MTDKFYDELLTKQGRGWRKTLGMDELGAVVAENGLRWLRRGGFAGEWEPTKPREATKPYLSDAVVEALTNGWS